MSAQDVEEQVPTTSSNRSLRVAHVTTIDVGLRYLLLDQLCFLRNAGWDVMGISTPGKYVEQLEEAGIRHIAVPMTRQISPLQDLVSLWRLYRVMRREKLTIVHTHNTKPGLLGQLAAKLARVPIIVNTLHGFYFHEHMSPRERRFYIFLEWVASRCSHSILSQNREDIDTALRERICEPERIQWLGNGIDLSVFAPSRYSVDDVSARKAELNIPDDAQVVGFVGRLSAKRKGFLDFLAAARKLHEKHPQLIFLIIGEADVGKPDAVEPERAREFGIDQVCRFLGQRPNDELPLLYHIMDVFVLPSIFEGVPRVIMECAAMGVPTVASNVKGNREAVIDGETGTLVPYGDVGQLASAIDAIISDAKLADDYGAAAQRFASERFDQQTVFHKVLAEYDRLLKLRGIPQPDRKPVA